MTGTGATPLVARPPRWEPHSWTGGSWSGRVACVLCPNPSPLTLEGTNTWVVGEPGHSDCLVIDPGPADEAHLEAILAVVAGRRVAQVLLTHRHPDHAEGAPEFAARVDAPVRAFGAGSDDLTDGEVIREAGAELSVLASPGHTSDSVCFLLRGDGALFSGDTVLGWGTSVVTWPDGVLGDYLASLAKIEKAIHSGVVTDILPGHGGPLADAAATVAFYRRHRLERLDQVRSAVAQGARDADEVVEQVYADVDRSLWPAAALSVRAQLDYLTSGDVVV